MEPQTPGQQAEAGTAPTAAAEAATSQATPPQTPAAPPQQEAEQGTPTQAPDPNAAATGRDEKGRFVSAEERAKAGEAGGWMVHLPPEDREELKREPWKYREMKAKLAAMEQAQTRYSPQAPAAPPAPDAAEVYAKRMTSLNARSANLTPEEFYREQASIQRDMAEQVALDAARKAATTTYKEQSEADQIRFINSQPEVKDERFVRYMLGVHAQAGGRLTPAQAFEMARSDWSEMTKPTNGHAKPAVPPPPLGELRSSAQPPTQPSVTGREKFARSPGGRALNEGRR